MFRTRSQTVHTTRPSIGAGRRLVKILAKGNDDPAQHDALSRGKSLSPSQYSVTNGVTDDDDDRVSPLHSQSDLTLRKSVFSRKSYGSADMLNAIETGCLSNNAGTFRVETGEHNSAASAASASAASATSASVSVSASAWQLLNSNNPIHVENPEFQTRWYFKYFLGRPHQNFVGADADRKEAFILSFIVNETGSQYRAILWRKQGAQKVSLPCAAGKSLSAKLILAHFDVTKFEYGPKEIQTPEIQGSLLQLEEQEGSLDHKFGVIYAKEGQNCDDQMYSNETGSAEFESLIALLGERIELQGWTGFRAGLDVLNGTTGAQSVHTVYEGHEVMWHVSTLLPYSADNRQQVERKRHIGNDVVNVVFVDECPGRAGSDSDSDSCTPSPSPSPSWRPCMMKTHFTHIFAVVHYVRARNAYRLAIYSHKDVPLFGPPLPCPPEFTDHKEFREFLLVKLINGEKAAFNIAVFAQKRAKSIEMLIASIVDQYYGDLHKTPLSNRKSMSEAFAEQSSYQEARKLEFVKVGQTLKLRTILKGDAPTSLVTSSLIRREPWLPHPILCDMNFDALAGDSWGDKLVLSTTKGLLLLDDKDMSPRTLVDSSLTLRQMVIIEIYGLLIGLPERGKTLYVVPLSALDAVLRARLPAASAAATATASTCVGCVQTAANKIEIADGAVSSSSSSSTSASICVPPGSPNGAESRAARTLPTLLDKDALKCCKLQKSKGCQQFCISKPFSKPLQLLVCAGKKVSLFLWKSTISNAAALSNWNQFRESNVESAFHLVRELSLPEQPDVQCFVDGPLRATRICVGYRNQYDLLDEYGEVLQSFKIDSSVKATMTSPISICADDEAELLLTYNNTSRFQKMNTTDVSKLEFKWSTVPLHVVCAFPYIIGFSTDAIEIRLIINGNLIYTRHLPNLQVYTSKCDIVFGTTALFVNGLLPHNNSCSVNSSCVPACGVPGCIVSANSHCSMTPNSSGIYTDPPSTGSTQSKTQLGPTRSIKFNFDGTHGVANSDSNRRMALYRIPLACLTTGQCSLEKTRTASNVSATHPSASHSLSVASQDRVSSIAYSVQI